MAQEVEISRGAVGKVRSFPVGLALTIVTFGIYHLVWYYLTNEELKEIGAAKEDQGLAQSSPALSVTALIIGWVILVPPLISVFNFGRRIQRAQRLVGVRGDQQINPILAFLMLFPGSMLIVPTFVYYWYVTKHQNMAVRGAGGLPPGGDVPMLASPA